MIAVAVIVVLLVLFIGWGAVLQRRRGGTSRPEELGRDKGMSGLL
jgi:hypothetical protein